MADERYRKPAVPLTGENAIGTAGLLDNPDSPLIIWQQQSAAIRSSADKAATLSPFPAAGIESVHPRHWSGESIITLRVFSCSDIQAAGIDQNGARRNLCRSPFRGLKFPLMRAW
jgi:hypothetical protein